MGDIKINRCWRKFVFLFIKAYFCLRSFQCSTWSENGVGCHQGYFRVCRWNWRERKLANICKCNGSFSCCQHSKGMQYFWRLATLQRWPVQFLSFLVPQYICLQSLAGLVYCLVLCFINVLEPNYQNRIKNMIYDLWSCADQSEQFLDQKCYMFVSNFAGSSFGLLRWANQRWEIEKNDIDLNSTYRGANFFLQRLIVRCFQAFNNIFPPRKKTSVPPPPPIIHLETYALTPPFSPLQPNPHFINHTRPTFP